MAGKRSLTGQLHREPIRKRTSIGEGLRKRGSFSKKRQKPSRGQGK